MTRFVHYQEIRVARPMPTHAEYAGLIGVILGIGQAAGHPAVYGVQFPDHEHIDMFEAHELEPTGRQLRREDLYDDSIRLRVKVDDHGRGKPA